MKRALFALLALAALSASAFGQAYSLTSGAGGSSTITSTVPDNTKILEFAASANDNGVPWGILFNDTDFVGTGLNGENYTNDVIGFGWLPTNTIGGASEIPGKISMWYGMEYKYFQGGAYGSEAHLETVDTNGVRHRPWHWFLNHDGSTGKHYLRVDQYVMGNWAEAQKIDWNLNGNYADIGSSASAFTFRFRANNAPTLTQRNAANTAYLNLPYFLSDNRLAFDAAFRATGATPTTGGLANIFAQLAPDSLAANGKILDIAVPTTTGDIFAIQQKGSTTGNIYSYIEQSGTGRASFRARATGTGDAVYQALSDGATWTWGADSSDSDAFVISASSTLGTTNVLRIDLSAGTTDIKPPTSCTGKAAGTLWNNAGTLAICP
jgi:hypothetical protein